METSLKDETIASTLYENNEQLVVIEEGIEGLCEELVKKNEEIEQLTLKLE